MKSLSFILLLGITITTSQGCTAYLARPVTVHLRDAETKQPISSAKLNFNYLAMLDFGVLLVPDAGKTKYSNSEGESVFWIDPYKDTLSFNFEKEGYPSESYHYLNSSPFKVVPRKWYQWKNDIYLDMYTLPQASLELILPDGYRGPVVLRFADHDQPPKIRGQRVFIYAVPKDGVVDIGETKRLFRNERNEIIPIAQFENGKRIQSLCGNSKVKGISDDPDGPMLHEISIVWEAKNKVYCVGSFADAYDINKKLEERFKIWEQSDRRICFDVTKELHRLMSRFSSYSHCIFRIVTISLGVFEMLSNTLVLLCFERDDRHSFG